MDITLTFIGLKIYFSFIPSSGALGLGYVWGQLVSRRTSSKAGMSHPNICRTYSPSGIYSDHPSSMLPPLFHSSVSSWISVRGKGKHCSNAIWEWHCQNGHSPEKPPTILVIVRLQISQWEIQSIGKCIPNHGTFLNNAYRHFRL